MSTFILKRWYSCKLCLYLVILMSIWIPPDVAQFHPYPSSPILFPPTPNFHFKFSYHLFPFPTYIKVRFSPFLFFPRNTVFLHSHIVTCHLMHVQTALLQQVVKLTKYIDLLAVVTRGSFPSFSTWTKIHKFSMVFSSNLCIMQTCYIDAVGAWKLFI